LFFVIRKSLRYDQRYRLASNINLVVFCIRRRFDTLCPPAPLVSFPCAQGNHGLCSGILPLPVWRRSAPRRHFFEFHNRFILYFLGSGNYPGASVFFSLRRVAIIHIEGMLAPCCGRAFPGIHHVLPWGEYEGNHGPWRHFYNLRRLLYYVFQIPIPVFAFGIVSLAIKPSKLTAVITVGSVIALYALIWSHYWLID